MNKGPSDSDIPALFYVRCSTTLMRRDTDVSHCFAASRRHVKIRLRMANWPVVTEMRAPEMGSRQEWWQQKGPSHWDIPALFYARSSTLLMSSDLAISQQSTLSRWHAEIRRKTSIRHIVTRSRAPDLGFTLGVRLFVTRDWLISAPLHQLSLTFDTELRSWGVM